MISVLELRARFELQIDKYETGYFEDFEVARFLNMAQEALVKEIFNDRVRDRMMNGEYKLKMEDSAALNIFLSALFESRVSGQMTTAGSLTYAEVEAAMGNGKKFFFPLSVQLSKGGTKYSAARFTRFMGKAATIDNAFLSPIDCDPIYTTASEDLGIWPDDTLYFYKIDVFRWPSAMVLDDAVPANNVDCELDEQVANEIVERAARFAAISIRDTSLYQGTTAETTQNQV